MVAQPPADILPVGTLVDLGREVVGPAEEVGAGDVGGGGGRADAKHGVGDRGVPGGVQVGAVALEGDGHVVGALAEGLGVQRLGNVAEEVDDEAQGLVALLKGEFLVLDALGLTETNKTFHCQFQIQFSFSQIYDYSIKRQTTHVVSNSRNHTTLGRTILGQDQVAALRRRRVMAVDKVQAGRPRVPFFVPERVRPRRNVAHVRRRVVAQNGLHLLHRLGRQVLLRDRGNGSVAELAPGADGSRMGQYNGEDGGRLHFGRW